MTDIANIFYQSARAELIDRIRLRDQFLHYHLVAVGLVTTLVLSRRVGDQVALIIPLMSVATAFVVSVHHEMIGSLRHYLCTEVYNKLSPTETPITLARHWDASNSLKDFHKYRTGYRTVAHFILIAFPAVASLVSNWHLVKTAYTTTWVLWWLGSLSTLLSVCILYKALSWHRYLHNQAVEISMRTNAKKETL